ncbi:MAG: hypothetical protein HZB19_06585 [Chloroflexi bacterium]|nr:hypothetical protein [Chloroflexota bacterium]
MSTNRSNVGALVGGSVLIALGLLTMAGQIFRGFNFWGTIWPFFVIGFGALFFVGMFAGGKSVAGLAIPGSIITSIGLMLFLQNLFGHWESWAYGWTVILMSVGLGIFIMGWYTDNASQRQSGLSVLKIGAVLFIIFGGFFEMIFNSFSFSKYLLPLVLILLGIYLVIARSGLLARRSNPVDDSSDMSAKSETEQK